MRRRPLTEGTLDEIIAELEKYGSDRADGPHSKPEKAVPFARALAALECGAVEVEANGGVYRVTGWRSDGQYLTVERDRSAITAELLEQRERVADSDRREYEQAVYAVAKGALAVFADGTLYRIVE